MIKMMSFALVRIWHEPLWRAYSPAMIYHGIVLSLHRSSFANEVSNGFIIFARERASGSRRGRIPG